MGIFGLGRPFSQDISEGGLDNWGPFPDICNPFLEGV